MAVNANTGRVTADISGNVSLGAPNALSLTDLKLQRTNNANTDYTVGAGKVWLVVGGFCLPNSIIYHKTAGATLTTLGSSAIGALAGTTFPLFVKVIAGDMIRVGASGSEANFWYYELTV